MKRSPTCVLPAVLLAIAAAPTSAEGGKQPHAIRMAGAPASANGGEKPNVIRMTVRPAGEPVPALKYQLLPGLLERKEGNAALLYYRMLDRIDGKDDRAQLDKWLEMPPGELPRKEVAALLGKYSAVLDETDRAARRNHCEWAFPVHEEGFALTLPPLTKFRHLGWLLALQARLQIAEGKLDQAVRTCQTGFALARHQADGKLLINGLIGVSIADVMARQVQQLSQAPDGPNLYWALATIRAPAIDLREAIWAEMHAIYLWFPALRNARTGKPITAAQWEDFLRVSLNLQGNKLGGKLGAVALGIKLYPHAKRYLAGRGYSRKQIDDMPVRKALAIYMVETSERVSHDVCKWLLVPYAKAHAGMRQGEAALRRAAADPAMPGFPVTMMLPALGRAYFKQAQLDRRLAALRCIEAVRMYAAAHDGRPPARLDDVRQVPIPVNPATREPFGYRVRGKAFTLTAKAPPDMPPRDSDRYEVALITR